jgi:chromosome segregation protein
MRIKELQLYGFKSFPHKTAIRFSTGINAIIGPNGCGKSNILDALRWVLGEQSFSVLRCGKNEDVVFAGAASVPALGYAEVRLTLDNLDELPGYGSEIEVRRRYFRSGESEYFLNRNACRLKDIQDIFYNTGTGTKAYSIFDLRSLRAIIAGELRPMFEEAATLAKYRERKTDCLRKLELTDADLLRVNDIVGERERITRSLKRQAYRLSAHDRLRAEEKRLQLMSLKDQHDAARTQEQAAARELQASEETDARQLAAIQQQEAELEALRASLTDNRRQRESLSLATEALRTKLARNESLQAVARSELQRFADEARQLATEGEKLRAGLAQQTAAQAARRSDLEQLSALAARSETDLEAARAGTRQQEARLLELRQALAQEKETSRSILERRIELQRAGLSLAAQIANAREYRDRLSSELLVLEGKTAEIKTALARREQELAQATANLERVQGRVIAQRRQEAENRSRLEELRQAIQRRTRELLAAGQELALLQSALNQPARAAAQAGLGAAFLGSVSDFLLVSDGYELAVEAALSEVVDCFVTGAEARSALPNLDRNQRWRFILRAASESGTGESSSEPSLADHVELKDGAPPLLKLALSRTRLVDNLEQAWAAAQAHPQQAYVTRDGIGVLPNGIIVLESARQGRLVAARRAHELESAVAALKEQLLAHETEVDRRNQDSAVLAQAVESGDQEIVSLVNARSQVDTLRAGLAANLADLSQDLNRQRTEVNNLSSRLAEFERQGRQAADQLAAPEEQLKRSEARRVQLEQEIAGLEQAVKSGLEQASRVLLKLTLSREQVGSRDRELELYQREIEQDRAHRAEIDRRGQALEVEASLRRRQIEQSASERAALSTDLDARNRELAAIDLSVLAGREEKLMKGLQQQRSTLETARSNTLELKLRSMEASHQRAELEREAQAVFGTALAEFTAEPEPDVAGKLRLIRARLERLGRVNPLSGDEFRKEKEELDRLLTQRADVLAAKENLLKTVAEIDRFAREQFVTTFTTVRDGFRDIFARLFVEGEADLLLESPDHPLESEITIVARPKGKSPKRLDQLSDGEKALLALSLLFAFYRVKPAPFCFLDEVDAPLDDANVDRFALFLKELSRKTQVVIITHNRATVEQADQLLGVTTEEPGVSKIVSVKLGDFTSAERRLIPPVTAPVTP